MNEVLTRGSSPLTQEVTGPHHGPRIHFGFNIYIYIYLVLTYTARGFELCFDCLHHFYSRVAFATKAQADHSRSTINACICKHFSRGGTVHGDFAAECHVRNDRNCTHTCQHTCDKRRACVIERGHEWGACCEEPKIPKWTGVGADLSLACRLHTAGLWHRALLVSWCLLA